MTDLAHGLGLPDPDTPWLWGPAYLALGAMLVLFEGAVMLFAICCCSWPACAGGGRPS